MKLWDLERGVEKCALGLHQNNVLCVRLIPGTELAISVSMSTVRVWDLRMEKCIRILLSSGLAVDGLFSAACLVFNQSVLFWRACLVKTKKNCGDLIKLKKNVEGGRKNCLF